MFGPRPRLLKMDLHLKELVKDPSSLRHVFYSSRGWGAAAFEPQSLCRLMTGVSLEAEGQKNIIFNRRAISYS